MGRVFFEKLEYDSAKHYLEQVVLLSDQIENSHPKFYAYSLLGQIPTIEPAKTEMYLTEALDLAYTLGMEREKMDVHTFLAELYLNLNKYDLTIQHARRAMTLAERLGSTQRLQQVFNALVKAYTIKEEFEKAEYYVIKYRQLNDSISDRKSEYMSGLVGVNEMADEERNYEVVREQLDAAQLRIEQKNTFIGFIAIAVILTGIVILLITRANRQKIKSYDELKKLNYDLDISIQEKDLLLGMIVHDLRSPLDKIYGLTEVFKVKMNLSDDHKQVVDMMQKIILDTKTLTEELLEINKLESGNFEIRNNLIELWKFTEDILLHYNNIAEKKGINIETSYELEKGIVRCDKLILQRIIENLISNAIKFNLMNGTVYVRIVTSSDSLSISVKDNGPGIPKEEIGKLFMKFSKASTRPTANESSTGLGLYIVRRFVEGLNGTIDVQSALGNGTEFIVDIPLS